jgi:ferredoxin
MKILYFTATGNGLHIAKTIGGELVSIPKIIRERNYSFTDDKIGIVFPIFACGVPHFIKDFLQKVQLNSEYIFAIMSYGMYAGATTDNLKKIASENNIHFSYINTIRMVDNYLPNFKMEDQIKNEHKKRIELNLSKIMDDIKNGKKWFPKNLFFDKMITKSLQKSDIFKTGIGFTNKFNVEDACVKCDICVKACPVDNIKVNNAKPVFNDNCISCLACTQNCPQNCIRLLGEKSKERFRNNNVTLQEIIQANN